jgi:hypothetical protein
MKEVFENPQMMMKYFNRAVFLLFIAFVALISFYIVLNAEWILGDDKQTMLTTGSGVPLPMFSDLIGGGIANGRFCPMAHQELNLLTLIPFGYTPLAHYIFNAFFFIVLSFLSVIYLRSIQRYYFNSDSIILPILTYLFLFIGCTVLTTFLDVIYGRITSILYLLVFYLVILNIKRNKDKYLIYSIPIVFWLTFRGETLFSSFFVIGATLLLFNYKNNSKTLNRYALFLICDAIFYLLLYAVIVLPQAKSNYTSIPNDHFFRDLLLWTPHAVLILVLTIIRLYFIVVKKDTTRIYLDAILFGGAVLVAANIVLRLSTTYYYMSIMVFLMPSVLYWGYYFFINKRRVFYVLCAVMFFMFIRPIHLFPYLIINNQHRRTTEMACIRQVEPYVKKDGYKLFFLAGSLPEGSYERNIRIFVKRALKETYEFETKRNIQTIELTDITQRNYPYLFVTKQDIKYIEETQRNYLLQNYDSLLSFGDLNVVFYKLR